MVNSYILRCAVLNPREVAVWHAFRRARIDQIGIRFTRTIRNYLFFSNFIVYALLDRKTTRLRIRRGKNHELFN